MEHSLTTMLLACAVAVAPAQDTAIERHGKHFQILCHAGGLDDATAGVMADQALAVVEASWPMLQKLLPGDPPAPAPIHLYGNVKDYRAVENQCPLQFHVNGFVAAKGEGHVLLWPELPVALLSAVGLPGPTADLLRQVAAEQAVRPLIDDTVDGHWLRDTLVFGIVGTLVNPRHKPNTDSCDDERRQEAVGQGIGNRIGLADLTRRREPTADRGYWLMRQAGLAVLAQHLASIDASWARKLLRAPKPRRPRDPHANALMLRLEEVVGSDWPKAEARFSKTCADLQPLWDTRAPLWQIGPERSLLAGTAQLAATIWSLVPVPKGDYAISGSFEAAVFGDKPDFRLQLGWDGKTLVGAYIWPDGARIDVWDSTVQKWLDGPRQPFQWTVGVRVPFRVEVDGKEVRLMVGEQRLAWPHAGRELHTNWGCAANDIVVFVRDLRIEPLPPARR